MKKNDMISLRREKLRNLLRQEMERYQYEVYSNNGSQYLLDKFNAFNNYINGNKPSEMNMNNNDSQYQYQNRNQSNNININNVNNQQGQNGFMNNNQNFMNNQNYGYQSEPNQQVNNNNNYYQNQGGYSNGNNMGNYNYGNLDIDEQINNYNDHYNRLKMDEFMSKKSMQDDLLNKINQKLMKINKDIDDKVYQEHLAAQWQQNHQNKNP